MRKALRDSGKVIKFTARYIKRGSKRSRNGDEVRLMFADIVDDDGKYIANHCWVKLNSDLFSLELGQKIQAVATVRQYKKSGGKIDYALDNVRRVKIL